MEYAAQKKLELFAQNTQIIKKEFYWSNVMAKRLAALLYAQVDKTIDCEAIRQCLDLIKQNTGVFSKFRGNMTLCMASMLSLSPNPEKVFSETMKVYTMLKGVKFHASDFLAIAAYQIAAGTDAANYENVITRARGIYDGMKAHHFFYTGEDDYIFAAMLGLADLDVAMGVERIEQLYSQLKGEFWDKNSVQALAQVLVLGDSDDSISNRILGLRDALREQKIKLDKAYTLPILGILALLPVEIDTIVRDIGIVQDNLRVQKGFGSLSLSTQELLMFASSILACDYAESVTDGVLTATLSTNIANIIIAQQMAMILLISAASGAAAGAAASS